MNLARRIDLQTATRCSRTIPSRRSPISLEPVDGVAPAGNAFAISEGGYNVLSIDAFRNIKNLPTADTLTAAIDKTDNTFNRNPSEIHSMPNQCLPCSQNKSNRLLNSVGSGG